MSSQKQKELSALLPFVSENRKKRFAEVLNERTRHITIVVEDVCQGHNASALIRTAECLGIQDVHVIEKDVPFQPSPGIAIGASKWLTIERHEAGKDTVKTVAKKLKKEGYKIVGMTPRAQNSVETLDTSSPFAVVFGNEVKGMTDEWKPYIDDYCSIPMFGFTESFNVSVSAGIVLQNCVRKVKETLHSWRLSEEEEQEILLSWAKTTVKNHKKILSQLKI